MKSQLAIKRELAAVFRARQRARSGFEHDQMMGAQQALAWALEDNAARPSTCVPRRRRRRRQ